MNIKNRVGLSVFTSFIYIILIEAFYIINASSFTFKNTLSVINNMMIKYLCVFIITSLFYFVFSYVLYPLFKSVKNIKAYFIISGITFIIHNVFLLYFNLLPEIGLLSSEISFFFVIIFTTTIYFYSITYYNLLK